MIIISKIEESFKILRNIDSDFFNNYKIYRHKIIRKHMTESKYLVNK